MRRSNTGTMKTVFETKWHKTFFKMLEQKKWNRSLFKVNYTSGRISKITLQLSKMKKKIQWRC